MVALSNEVEKVKRSIDVGRDRRPEVWIEIGETRAVDYQIKVANEPTQGVIIEPKPGFGDISLNDLNSIAQELWKILAVTFVKGFEDGRLFHDSLEAALRRCRTRPPYQ